MSTFEPNDGLQTTGAQGQDNTAGKAKAVIGQAGEALKQEAQTFATAAQERARDEVQKHAQTATKTLGDFANAVRRAGDELASNDQSFGAQLVRQAADGLETMSRNLADKQPEDLLNAVRDFGRRHPAAFIGGAVLAGIALGRFVRASGDEGLGGGGFGAQRLGSDGYAEGMTGGFGEDLTVGADLEDSEEPAFGAAGPGLDAAVSDDLGGLQASDVDDSTSVLGVDEGNTDVSPYGDRADPNRQGS